MSIASIVVALVAAFPSLTWSQESDAAPPASTPPTAFAGDWRDLDEPTRLVRIETGKLRILDHDALEITRVEYSTDSVIRHVSGTKEIWHLELTDGTLSIAANGKPWHLARVDKSAANASESSDPLVPRPLTLPPPKPIDPVRVSSVCAELKTRRDKDQGARKGTIDANECESIDRENTAWLKSIVAELGWIDVDRFGKDASNAAFLLVQHSRDLPLMLCALPEIEKDVKAKKLDSQNFALLFDRTKIRLGEKQRYGTQLGRLHDGTIVVLALEDRQDVEQLRASIGLFSMTKYLDGFKDMTKQKDASVVFEDDLKD